jgi:hypothetical protein
LGGLTGFRVPARRPSMASICSESNLLLRAFIPISFLGPYLTTQRDTKPSLLFPGQD